MAPTFGYAPYGESFGHGWSPEVEMDGDQKNNGRRDNHEPRKRTPSPGAGVAKLGRQLSDMQLQQPPTFTKLRKQLQPP